MINYSHNTPLDILYIIKQLVSGYNGKVEKLLPIRGISKGFELGNKIQKLKFLPPKEYEKEGYEVEYPLGDDEKRVEELTKLNNDIREHNKWAIEQNEKLGKQLLIKVPAAKDVTIVGDAKDLGIHLDYPKLDEYEMWQITVIIENPKDKNREFDPYDRYSTIDNRQLYLFAKELPEDEFVRCFNKTIFDYLLKERKEVEELGIWDSEHIWWHPVREFSMWFNINKQNHKDIESFILIKRKNKGGRPKGEGGRPKDPKVAKKRGELNKRYYHLTEKEGLKKSHAIKKLVQEFPWAKSTIEKYIK